MLTVSRNAHRRGRVVGSLAKRSVTRRNLHIVALLSALCFFDHIKEVVRMRRTHFCVAVSTFRLKMLLEQENLLICLVVILWGHLVISLTSQISDHTKWCTKYVQQAVTHVSLFASFSLAVVGCGTELNIECQLVALSTSFGKTAVNLNAAFRCGSMTRFFFIISFFERVFLKLTKKYWRWKWTTQLHIHNIDKSN